ncbi:hypothetical protein [Asanoa iriomotensis]|uniref:Uncharacterized protein n=1 Tax=Asanoa iriomotensis TaxID=234613 RepID=A0ABQ4C100_9ACTN|nr:hypothetical protein [Asanoa iriomotensis]GIF56445.1 hypothetical protein Air01nite_25400 [Asanoa iriomotensis]
MADLDGKPGDELVTTLKCENDGSVHPTQLLALKVAGDGSLSPLGFVLDQNVTAPFTSETVAVDNGVVRVTVFGPYQSDGNPPCDRQVRGYAYLDGAFRQVDGPTEFTKPPTNFREIDFRNAGFNMGRSNPDQTNLYCVKTVDGVGEADLLNDYKDATKDRTRYSVSVGPVSFVDTEAFAILTLRSPSGEVSQTLQRFYQDGDYPLGEEVLRSGTEGVVSIDRAKARGAVVTVTVTTAGGTRDWTYRKSATSQLWERVGS